LNKLSLDLVAIYLPEHCSKELIIEGSKNIIELDIQETKLVLESISFEHNQCDDLGLLYQPLDDVAVLVDDTLLVIFVNAQDAKLFEDLHEAA